MKKDSEALRDIRGRWNDCREHRDELLEQVKALEQQLTTLREALVIAETTAANLHSVIRDRDAQTAELPTMQQRSRWATFLERWIDENYDAHGSDVAWGAFVQWEHNTPPMHGCVCAVCRAAAPDGETHGE